MSAAGRTPRDRHTLLPAALRPLSRRLGLGYRRLEHDLRNATSTVHPDPILVLGNQKSGTSAIADLLGRACGLSVSIDMKMEVQRPTYPGIHTGELRFDAYVRANRFEFSHDIVKEPNLTLLHPWLREAFPEARMLFVLRDPRDNIRSLLDALGMPGDLPRLEERHKGLMNPGWELVLDGRWLGIEGDHYVEQLAGRWNRTADVYLENRDSLVLSRYEDFLKDKVGELARLAETIGRPVVHDVSGEVDRQYQERGQRGVAWRDFFGSDHLDRIEAICGERMRALDYALSGSAR